jgi:hypothetical protein
MSRACPLGNQYAHAAELSCGCGQLEPRTFVTHRFGNPFLGPATRAAERATPEPLEVALRKNFRCVGLAPSSRLARAGLQGAAQPPLAAIVAIATGGAEA